MNSIEISAQEAILYIALLNAVIGFILGLIPLLFGYFKGQFKLGLIGILVATVGGAFLGLFVSVPAVVIFTWLVVRASKRPGPPAASEVESGNN